MLLLVSAGFTVFATGIDAPAGGALDAPEEAVLVVSLEAVGQATVFVAGEGDADPAAVVDDPPDEQAVTPRPRIVIPAITLSVLRAVMMNLLHKRRYSLHFPTVSPPWSIRRTW
ncbi:hypothetical protein ACFWFF_37430, partial [Streptomyces sp. NPDC060223]|uniref:hypothetical protein n=1 Tax=Streptomyces sp. NPDC060223 TaxID=3347077 RepID=UPI00364FC006